jgi:hypothetical protein
LHVQYLSLSPSIYLLSFQFLSLPSELCILWKTTQAKMCPEYSTTNLTIFL